MIKEMKICLPVYKLLYSFCFILGLSLARGVTYISEIGIAMEPFMAVLSFVFMADTYVQEVVSKRAEVQRLYPVKRRAASLYRRIAVQGGYLFLLSVIGFVFFIVFQQPSGRGGAGDGEPGIIFLLITYAAAVFVTIHFWGILSNTISSLFGTAWAGIGGCLLLWVLTNSQAADKLWGSWGLFSYVFRSLDEFGNAGALDWIQGKAVCICLAGIMLAAAPRLLKRNNIS